MTTESTVKFLESVGVAIATIGGIMMGTTHWKIAGLWTCFAGVLLGLFGLALHLHREFRSEEVGGKLPVVSFQNTDGFTPTEYTGNPVDPEKMKGHRQHYLTISNPNPKEIANFDVEIQLPLAVVDQFQIDRPAGTEVVLRSVSDDIGPQQIHVSPGVKRVGPPAPTPNFDYHLEISSLPPNRKIVIGFLTSTNPKLRTLYFMRNTMIQMGGLSGHILSFIRGTYEEDGQSKTFFSEIKISNGQDLIAEPTVDQNANASRFGLQF